MYGKWPAPELKYIVPTGKCGIFWSKVFLIYSLYCLGRRQTSTTPARFMLRSWKDGRYDWYLKVLI
jgi:hypothetical protein